MDKKDICSLRRTCDLLFHNSERAFTQALIQGRVIYSRSASMAHFFAVLNAFPASNLGLRVKSLTLVADGLKEHEYGSEWAWEEMQHRLGLDMTADDQNIIARINNDHANEMHFSSTFLNSGHYRTMLGGILSMCPNLRVLNIRKLQPDEHVPGWTDISLFKQLSFYRPCINIKSIYYGDWQYDTVHLRVTHYTDEFGDSIIEDNAGPQASFDDDVKAAIASTGQVIEQKFLD
ncbi:hypothetical protein DE146DRAFT_208282 [Phaeosphaeria sp. MPI-PUGE-AT-0046c]|nr:hypothetical protein DE146DRAFT_208282 [Phaeosphaeria sp. MPI-PUGE-AT-0046c]